MGFFITNVCMQNSRLVLTTATNIGSGICPLLKYLYITPKVITIYMYYVFQIHQNYRPIWSNHTLNNNFLLLSLWVKRIEYGMGMSGTSFGLLWTKYAIS